jgi:hypothetical protein
LAAPTTSLARVGFNIPVNRRQSSPRTGTVADDGERLMKRRALWYIRKKSPALTGGIHTISSAHIDKAHGMP